jgi:hypothetical protein
MVIIGLKANLSTFRLLKGVCQLSSLQEHAQQSPSHALWPDLLLVMSRYAYRRDHHCHVS